MRLWYKYHHVPFGMATIKYGHLRILVPMEKPPELSHSIAGSKMVQALWSDGNILYLARHLG